MLMLLEQNLLGHGEAPAVLPCDQPGRPGTHRLWLWLTPPCPQAGGSLDKRSKEREATIPAPSQSRSPAETKNSS